MNPCLLFLRCGWCHWFANYGNDVLELLTFGETWLQHLLESEENQTRGAAWGAKTGPRGAQQRFQKSGREINTLPGEIIIPNGIPNLTVCRIIVDIFNDFT